MRRQPHPAIVIASLGVGLLWTGLTSLSPTPEAAAATAVSERANELVQALNQNSKALKSLKAFVEMKFLEPGLTQPHDCQGQLAFLREGSLYLKAFDSLAPHYFTLIVSEGKFFLLVPKIRTLYTGSAEMIGSPAFQLEINPSDLAKALLPAEIDAAPNEINLREENGLLRISLERKVAGGHFTERILWFTPERHDPVLESYFSPRGDLLLEIHRRDFQDHTGADGSLLRFPSEIKIRKILQGFDTSLSFKKLGLNGEIPSQRFQLVPPEGVSVENIVA